MAYLPITKCIVFCKRLMERGTHRQIFFSFLSFFSPLQNLAKMTLDLSFAERRSSKNVLDCSSGVPVVPSPTDCHSFYRCFDDASRPLKMSCGFLMFNPLLRYFHQIHNANFICFNFHFGLYNF